MHRLAWTFRFISSQIRVTMTWWHVGTKIPITGKELCSLFLEQMSAKAKVLLVTNGRLMKYFFPIAALARSYVKADSPPHKKKERQRFSVLCSISVTPGTCWWFFTCINSQNQNLAYLTKSHAPLYASSQEAKDSITINLRYS